MSCDTSADGMLTCGESPLWYPNNYSLSNVSKCKSCSLRFVTALPGPGTIIYTKDYMVLFNDNPTSSVIVDGTMYNLAHSYFLVHGLHRIPGYTTTCDAEVCFLFQPSQGRGEKFLCVSLPVSIGETITNQYFSTITNYATANRPTLGSLIPTNANFLHYRGPDNLTGRTKKTPQPRSECDPIKTVISYYVCLTSITISESDYNRFADLCSKLVFPPEPNGELSNERMRLITHIQNVEVESPETQTKSKKSPGQLGYNTSALKCYRLDKKDIVNDRVYINGYGKPGDTTLQDEMDVAASGEVVDDEFTSRRSSFIKPRDIEGFLSFILGLLIAIIVTAFIAYYILKWTNINYLDVLKLYKSIKPPA
jgi:hypothetical protein